MNKNAVCFSWCIIVTLVAINLVVSPVRASSHLGFAYQPYVGQWGNNPYWDGSNELFRYSTPAWGGTYSGGNWSIAKQLDLIAPHATRLNTYGAGVFEWQGQPAPNYYDTSLVAPAVANRNKSTGYKITMYQGVNQQVMNGTLGTWNGNTFTPNVVMAAELNKAVELAKNANAVVSGTVVGLVFTNEYAHDVQSTRDVRGLIQWYKANHADAILPVAVRIESWGQLKNTGDYPDQLKALLGEIDIVMMNIYPSAETVRQSIAAGNTEAAFNNVIGTFNDWKTAALQTKATLQFVLSETGWPVQGVWIDDAGGKVEGSATLAKNYFDRMRTWADQESIEVFYFEAISEPWKANKNWTPQDGPWPSNFPSVPPSAAQRVNGAEGHFGAWHYDATDGNGHLVSDFSVSSAVVGSDGLLPMLCPAVGVSMVGVAILATCCIGRRGRCSGFRLD